MMHYTSDQMKDSAFGIYVATHCECVFAMRLCCTLHGNVGTLCNKMFNDYNIYLGESTIWVFH